MLKMQELMVKHKGLKKKQAENLSKFMKFIPHELSISMWTKVISHGAEPAKMLHQFTSDYLLEIIGQVDLEGKDNNASQSK